MPQAGWLLRGNWPTEVHLAVGLQTGGPSIESQSKPGIKTIHPEPCKELTKKAAAIYGWDYPLLTFIYPDFDCWLLLSRYNPDGKCHLLSPDYHSPCFTREYLLPAGL